MYYLIGSRTRDLPAGGIVPLPTLPIIINGTAALFWGLGRVFSFLILHTVGRTPQKGDQPVARRLPIHRTTQTQNKHTQASMSQTHDPIV
jgi:hypothetical protein